MKRRTKKEKVRRAKLWEVIVGLCALRSGAHCTHRSYYDDGGFLKTKFQPLCQCPSCPILKLVEELL